MAKSSGNSGTNIDIRHVEYFLMLAEHGSISKAALALGLAQPSLSEHIARLETRLNTKLAIRGPRGVTLTEAGRLLTREGPALLALASKLTDSIRELGQDMNGNVSIALPPSLSALLSIPLAETLRLETPGIKLHLSEGLSGHILDWIEREEIDLGFVYTQPPSAAFQSDAVLEEELFLVAAADDVPVAPDADGNHVIEASELARLPLVMPSMPHSARSSIERFARASGIELNVILEINSLSQIVEMVARASGYSLLPHGAVAEAVEAGRLVLVRLKNPGFSRTAWLTRKRGLPVTMASLTVERTLLTILGELVGRFDLHAKYLGAPKATQIAEAG